MGGLASVSSIWQEVVWILLIVVSFGGYIPPMTIWMCYWVAYVVPDDVHFCFRNKLTQTLSSWHETFTSQLVFATSLPHYPITQSGNGGLDCNYSIAWIMMCRVDWYRVLVLALPVTEVLFQYLINFFGCSRSIAPRVLEMGTGWLLLQLSAVHAPLLKLIFQFFKTAVLMYLLFHHIYFFRQQTLVSTAYSRLLSFF